MIISEQEKKSRQQMIAENYVNEVYEEIKRRNPHENEFIQAVKEILDSLLPVISRHIYGTWNFRKNYRTRKAHHLPCPVGG